MLEVDCRSSCDARFALDPAGGRWRAKDRPIRHGPMHTKISDFYLESTDERSKAALPVFASTLCSSDVNIATRHCNSKRPHAEKDRALPRIPNINVGFRSL